MAINTVTIWIIYIIIFAIVYLILRYVSRDCQINTNILLFIASVIAAISVLITASQLNTNINQVDEAFIAALFVIALLIPIFIILYIFWLIECEKCGHIKTERFINCNTETKVCQLEKEVDIRDNNITTVVYSTEK